MSDSAKVSVSGPDHPTVLSSVFVFFLLLLASPATARSQQPDSSDGPNPIPHMAALVAQLDSGSQAFEEGRLQDARRHHLRAVEFAPDLTSAWFGLFMVEDSLGNEAAADSALMQVRRISPGAIPPELQDRLSPREPDR